MPTDRPALSLAIETEIEGIKRHIHYEYWPRLLAMQELTDQARAEYRQIASTKVKGPQNPKAPHALRTLLGKYALQLFEVESRFFPPSPDSRRWLAVLTTRLVWEITNRIAAVEADGKPRFMTLGYHGLTQAEMIQAMRDGMKEKQEQLGSEFERRMYNETARHLMGEPRREEPISSQLPVPSKESMRKKFIEPLLLARGWSMLQWALEAEVAYNTVADYLAGKKNPHSRTKVKLAKALGVTPNQLPN
jgi:lambda repressor-like predicted transcriptional regulator